MSDGLMTLDAAPNQRCNGEMDQTFDEKVKDHEKYDLDCGGILKVVGEP